MPMALMRRPPWAKRRSNQSVSSEWGWKRIHPHAIWIAMTRTLEFPALEMPRVTCLVAALIGRGREPGERGELLAAADVSPGEELEREEPGGLEADALEAHELTDHRDRRVGAVLELVELQALDETDPLLDTVAVLPLPEQPFVQPRWQG